MAWTFVDARVGAQPITTIETVARHPFGTIVRAVDPTYGEGEFQYVKGITSGTAKAWVVINQDDYTTTRLVANGIGPVGILMSALDASTKFGWAQISGKALGVCLTGYTDNGAVYCTSTDGAIDDTSVVGDLVLFAKGASAVANTGSTPLYAEFEIARPQVNDRHANK
jgi:hypothetical protein